MAGSAKQVNQLSYEALKKTTDNWWGVRGQPMDRLATLLVLMSFAIGTGAIGLLLLKRIDATQYGALALASLVVVFGLVMRWRALDPKQP